MNIAEESLRRIRSFVHVYYLLNKVEIMFT